jgi:SpoVK/Ycf46/Vps4 family AAA+-type ATPase
MRAAIQSLLADAKKALETGNREQAVVDYQQVASLYRRWANETGVPTTKHQYLGNADAYEQYANRLTTGQAPVAAPGGAQMERGDADEGGLDQQIEHLIHKSTVRWEDIGGLEETKEEIKIAYALSAVGMPEGVNLEGWRAILLYGPPGTGKTMLAAATSNGLQATFFNVALSSILSKYFGESSRLITTLYTVSRGRAPSVVYMDEFEAIATQRTGEESGAERRVLSTILSELDGIQSKSDPRYVLTIAATNVPWLLDKAILSRFQRKVLIPLPDPPARQAILSILLKKRGLTSERPLAEVVKVTEWLSGRELDAAVRATVNHMVMEMNSGLASAAGQGLEELKQYKLRVRSLSRKDWDAGLATVQRVTNEESYGAFLRFQREAGV